MRKVAIVFVLAVFVPSLVLAWLALRSLRDQQFVLEHQRSLLYQNVADTLARDAENTVLSHQRDFAGEVENLLAGNDPAALARSFDDRLRTNWPLAEVGFVVALQNGSGRLVSPTASSRPEARLFCVDNGTFLANGETAEVYWSGNRFVGNDAVLNNTMSSTLDAAKRNPAAQESGPNQNWKSEVPTRSVGNIATDNPSQSMAFADAQLQNNSAIGGQNLNLNVSAANNSAGSAKKSYRRVYPQQQGSKLSKNAVDVEVNNAANVPASQEPLKDVREQGQAQAVPPQKQINATKQTSPASVTMADRDENEVSKAVPADAEFQQLIGDSNDGMLARFVNNKLNLLLWYRSPRFPKYIFGAQLSLPRIVQELREPLLNLDASLREDICVALLDDSARPAALSSPAFRGNWKHPFVATEIGEELPHWEMAAYLIDPARLTQSARTARLTLALLIGMLVLAISIGSWLIAADLKRQLRLARQKTDFVSNVSHELKTPLTSIRMFSELLADGRVADPERQKSYLTIITAEAARLTRLINNVLDFSRLERGEKKYNMEDCDLAALARETFESYRPHLENNGFQLDCHVPETPLAVRGDCDALAQIIVNLLSNAEKYSDSRKEIIVEAARRDGPLPFAEVRVLDRGLGVPRDSEEKIFEKFYRAHDSLSSGIQGSGLGLTLARQIARAHGGDVVYEGRDGGGSCFALRLPMAVSTTEEHG
jgi:signal transduction histidine kinase